MNFKIPEKTKYLIFQISWIALLVSVICDFSIGTHFRVGDFQLSFPKPSAGPAVYVIIFFCLIPISVISKTFRSKPDRTVILILTALLGSVYLSAFLSELSMFALNHTIFRFTLFFVCFVCTVICTYYFRDSINFIIKSLIFINLLVVLSSIADFYIPAFNQFLVDHFGHLEPKHSVLNLGGVKYMRPSGFVSDTNLTAFSIAVSCLMLVLNEDKVRIGWFKHIFYALSGYSFGMLASRSALIALVASLIVFFVTKKIERKKIYGFLLVFFVIQLATPQTIARIEQIIDRTHLEEEITTSRWILWQAAFKAFESSPVTGLGTGVFFVKSIDYMQGVWESYTNIDPEVKEKYKAAIKYKWNPHNIFLTMLSEEGLIGFTIFMILLVYYFQWLFKTKKYDAKIIMLALLFVSSLSNYAPYYKYYLVLCIALYIGAKQDMKILDNK